MTGRYELELYDKLNFMFRRLDTPGRLRQARAVDDLFDVYEKISSHLKSRCLPMPWYEACRVRRALTVLDRMGAPFGIRFAIPDTDIGLMDAAVMIGAAVDAYHRA